MREGLLPTLLRFHGSTLPRPHRGHHRAGLFGWIVEGTDRSGIRRPGEESPLYGGAAGVHRFSPEA
jgi:hypothetical protein